MSQKQTGAKMAWNDENNKNPWGGNNQTPPELEEVIKSLEVELESKNKNIEKLNKTGKNLVGYLIVSIIIGICGWWGLYITNN